MATTYKTPYQGKEKKSKDGRKYPKDFYNLRDLDSLEENLVLGEVWRSVHDYFGRAVAGNDAVMGVPFLSDTRYYYPYAVMTKSVKERPAKYMMHPHLSQFVTPETLEYLDTHYGIKEMNETAMFERKGLTGFGWEDPKGAVCVRITCTNIKQFYIPPMRPQCIRLQLGNLKADTEFLKKNVGERLYMVAKVFTAATMKIQVTISSVDSVYGSEENQDQEAYMKFEREFSPEKVDFGIPLAFMVQKIFLDPQSTKKAFKAENLPSEGCLIDKMDLCDNMKFKESGLWVPREPHPLDGNE